MPDRLTTRVRPPDAEAQGALVLLHGRGADQNDLAPLADVLDPERRLLVVSPRGPLSLPPGGAHWYALGGIGTPDAGDLRATFELLTGWLDAILDAHGLSLDRTVIGGFSQGAVMSWALGLGAGRPSPAGIMALSGFLPTVDGFSLDFDRPGLPVAIGAWRTRPGDRRRVEPRGARHAERSGRRRALQRVAVDGPLDRPGIHPGAARLARLNLGLSVPRRPPASTLS